MANVPLKSIKFPGLTDTYTVPQLDSALTAEGKAADAKAAGDRIGAAESVLENITSASGENMFDMSVFDGKTGITKVGFAHYKGAASAFKTAFENGIPGLIFEEATQYYLSFEAYAEGTSTSTSSGLRFKQNMIYGSTETSANISVPLNQHTFARFGRVSDENRTLTSISITWANGGTVIWHVRNVMLVKSTEAVDYVQHDTANDMVARRGISAINDRLDAVDDRFDVVESNVNDADGIAKQTVSAGALMVRNAMPSYYTDTPENPTSYEDIPYIDSRINAIPEGKHWLFFTDTHWDWGKNAKKSPMLIEYITQRAGIKNVIFGGDFINRASNDGDIKGRFLANQIVNDFGTRCISACGDGLLPVMGNHDNNLGNIDGESDSIKDDTYLPAAQVQKALFNNLPIGAHTYWESYGDLVLAKAHEYGITDNAENNAELKANCELTYYYDDKEQKIRYIVLDSTRPVHGIWKTFTGGVHKIAHVIPWMYDVFRTVPENYDVVIAQHTTISPSELGTGSQYTRVVTGFAMGLKAKAKKSIKYDMEFTNNASIQTYLSVYPDAEPTSTTSKHVFDFSDCPNVGRVIMLCGHVHYDFAAVFHPVDNNDHYYTVTEYAGEVVDQTDILMRDNKPVGCDIPCVWTTTDAFGCIKDKDGEEEDITDTKRVPMAKDTITEQAIDIYSLVDDADANSDGGIEITRIGACYTGVTGNIYGYDRRIKSVRMKW